MHYTSITIIRIIISTLVINNKSFTNVNPMHLNAQASWRHRANSGLVDQLINSACHVFQMAHPRQECSPSPAWNINLFLWCDQGRWNQRLWRALKRDIMFLRSDRWKEVMEGVKEGYHLPATWQRTMKTERMMKTATLADFKEIKYNRRYVSDP